MDRATIKMFIDQCDGMGLAGAADCIESLAAEIERLRRQIAEMRVEIERLKREAAAIQARERQLREALVSRAGEVMRERCAEKIESHRTRTWVTSAAASALIRTLPGVTLEDLKWY